jgi:hypothetical protein
MPHLPKWDDGVIAIEPTCVSDGLKVYTCACGDTRTELIPSIDRHADENGDLLCDRCYKRLNEKTGLVFDRDGEIRFYIAGLPTHAGLVRDSKGNYYYISSKLKAIKNCTYAFGEAKSNGLLPAGEYQFDASGKLILNY